jgi:hypothetical protein
LVGLRIELPEEAIEKLQKLADERKTTPEELVAQTVLDLLDQSDEELEHELDYLLKKHDELLRRLA